MSSLLVADISSNNGFYNADEYASAGHIAIAIKASEGTSFVDPDHRTWCLHSGMHHLAIVHYHFARPDLGHSPVQEAHWFLEATHGLRGGRDFLCLDLERATPQGFTHDPAWSREFDAAIQAATRFHTILYANESTLRISDAWLVGPKKRVWDANWSSAPDFAPKGYGLAMRQFTDGVFGPEPHSAAGIGRCDLNRMGARFYAEVRRNRR